MYSVMVMDEFSRKCAVSVTFTISGSVPDSNCDPPLIGAGQGGSDANGVGCEWGRTDLTGV